MKTSPSLKELIDMYNQVENVLTCNCVNVENNDYTKALSDLIDFNVLIATDPTVNGDSILFTLEERKILNKLCGEHWVGPAARPVLAKLKKGIED